MEELVDVGGVRVNVWRKGLGDPLFILMGWNGYVENYLSWMEEFVRQGFAVYGVESPGSGKSDAPRPNWTFEDIVSVTDGLMRHYGIEKAFIVGHSFGAVIALRFARLYPSCVRRLVLVNSPVLSTRLPFINKGHIPLWLFDSGFFLFAVMLKPAKWAVKAFWFLARSARLTKAWRALRDSNLEFAVRWLERQYIFLTRSKGIMRKIKRAIVRVDTAEDARAVKIPTLLLWGERGGITPPRNANVFRENMPHAEIYIIPQGPHHPSGAWAEIFAQLITQWTRRKNTE